MKRILVFLLVLCFAMTAYGQALNMLPVLPTADTGTYFPVTENANGAHSTYKMNISALAAYIGSSSDSAVFATRHYVDSMVVALGSGTVTSVSSGTLTPIFTTSVANATSTPAISYSLTAAPANSFFGNFTGSAAAPSYNAPGGTASSSTYLRGDYTWASPVSLVSALTGTVSAMFNVTVTNPSTTPNLLFAWANITGPIVFGSPSTSSGVPAYYALKNDSTAASLTTLQPFSPYAGMLVVKYNVTALAAGITINNPVGVWSDGEMLVVTLTDNGTSRTVGYGGNFDAGSTVTPITATTISARVSEEWMYDGNSGKWDFMGLSNGH